MVSAREHEPVADPAKREMRVRCSRLFPVVLAVVLSAVALVIGIVATMVGEERMSFSVERSLDAASFAPFRGRKARLEKDCAGVSVIVPITPARVSYMERLLESIAVGTRLPCEIIFAMSFVQKHDKVLSKISIPPILEDRVDILRSSRPQNAAENRNRAIAAASMPIVASLDSDDVASPVWMVSIEKLYREDPELDFTVHPWYWCEKGLPTTLNIPDNKTDLLHLNKILRPQMTAQQAFEWACCNYKDHPAWQNGHITFRRSVWDTVQQRTAAEMEGAEDSWFTADLLMRGFKGVFVNQQLTGYCKTVRDFIDLNVSDLSRYDRPAAQRKSK